MVRKSNKHAWISPIFPRHSVITTDNLHMTHLYSVTDSRNTNSFLLLYSAQSYFIEVSWWWLMKFIPLCLSIKLSVFRYTQRYYRYISSYQLLFKINRIWHTLSNHVDLWDNLVAFTAHCEYLSISYRFLTKTCHLIDQTLPYASQVFRKSLCNSLRWNTIASNWINLKQPCFCCQFKLKLLEI
jgi:hypothetical protein